MIKEVKGNELFWAKGNDTVIIPTKEDENGGFDIYANFEEEYIIIEPHQTKLIPTNLACAFSEDYVMILKERGSTGTKGMGQRCGIIDSGYRNLIFVPITNENNVPIVIYKDNILTIIEIESMLSLDERAVTTVGLDGIHTKCIKYPYSKAICQALIVPVPKMNSQEISLEELQVIPSKRGLGNLGSSGK